MTGCYAQLDPELLTAMEGVDAVVGTNEKKNITAIVRKLLGREADGTIQAVHDVMKGDEFEEIPPLSVGSGAYAGRPQDSRRVQ